MSDPARLWGLWPRSSTKKSVAIVAAACNDSFDEALITMEYRFSKRLRLLKSAEFDRVFQTRCSVADAMLILYAAPNELSHPRLGLVVSRKIGQAVLRNRWKRVMREAFRLTQHELPPLDYVCLPRPQAEPQLNPLMVALPRLAARLERKLKSMDSTSPLTVDPSHL